MRLYPISLARLARWMIPVFAAALIAAPTLAHDYTLPGGDSPEAPQPPKDPPPPLGDPPPEEDDDQTDNPSPDPAKEQDNETAAEPIRLFDGSLYHRHTDLDVPGRIPIIVRRNYHSFSEFNNLLGYGWCLSYHIRLFPMADGNLLLKRGDASKDDFTNNGDNTYSPPAGKYETLVLNGDGTYTLTRESGWQWRFDVNGCLSEICDRNDNQLLFSYDPAGLLPISGVSPYSTLSTPILLAYDYRLVRIEQARADVPNGRYVQLSYDGDGRLTLIEDFTGRQVTYTYDGVGDLVAVTDPEGNDYNHTYDGDHRMLTFEDHGCSGCSPYTNQYDSDGRVVQQTFGTGVVDIEYLVPGSRTKVTSRIYDDDSQQLLHTRYEYYDFDAAGYTSKLTRQMGSELDEEPGSTETDDIVTEYTYDPSTGRLLQKIDPCGSTYDYAYDAATGNLLTETITAPGGGDSITTTYEYTDPNAPHQYTAKEVSATFDPQIYRVEYTYWPDGRIKEEKRVLDVSTTYVTSYTYSPAGDLVTVTDPRGNDTAYEYDASGFRTRAYDPNNPSRQTLYGYDSLGNLASVTNARSNTATFDYDGLGRLTRTVNPLGEQTTYTFTGDNLTEVERGKTAVHTGQITRFEYDNLNRGTAVKMVDDGGAEVTLASFTYDSEGRLLSITDGNDNTTAKAYDVLGRLASVTDPLGHSTTYDQYDKNGNILLVTDAESHPTTYQYDFLNRTMTVQNALPGTDPAQYAYNALGDLIAIADARSNTWHYRRDRLSRLVEEEDPLGNITQYGYDGNDNLVSKITANEYAAAQRPIVYSYDPYNRLTTIAYPGGSKNVTFDYDLVDNLTAWNDGVLSAGTTYDQMNRATGIVTNYPGFAKTVSYGYDPFGNVRSVTDGEGRVTWYHYNALNRLIRIVHPGSLHTTYTYDTGGRLIEKALPNGVSTAYDYDIANRLTDLVHTGPAGVISSYAYTNDDVGNRLTMTTLEGVHTYGYDEIYQLTSAAHPEPANPPESYSYDPAGNRLTSSDHTDWTYDSANRLLSYDGVSFAYDPSGNTTGKTDPSGSTTYVHDFDNRLVEVTTPTSTATYTYDPFGTRLAKTVDGATMWFLYHGEDIIAEYDDSGVIQNTYLHGRGIDEPIAMVTGTALYPLADFDHNGTVDLADYDSFIQYFHGPGDPNGVPADLDGDGDGDLHDFAILATQLGAAGLPDGIYYYLADGLGSVTALCDQDTNVVQTYTYDAFGRTVAQTGSVVNIYTYTGREFDAESGCYYCRLRTYDPATGRFRQTDPIGYWGGTNLYTYVGHDPVNRTDPYGLRGDKEDKSLWNTILDSVPMWGPASKMADKGQQIQKEQAQSGSVDEYIKALEKRNKYMAGEMAEDVSDLAQDTPLTSASPPFGLNKAETITDAVVDLFKDLVRDFVEECVEKIAEQKNK